MKCKIFDTSGKHIGSANIDQPASVLKWGSKFDLPSETLSSGSDISYQETESYQELNQNQFQPVQELNQNQQQTV